MCNKELYKLLVEARDTIQRYINEDVMHHRKYDQDWGIDDHEMVPVRDNIISAIEIVKDL